MLDFEKDLDIFLNTDHFAQEFEVVGIGNVIKGIFQSPFLGYDMLGQAVNTEHVTVMFKTSDVVDNQIMRKTLLRKIKDNTVWEVKERRPDELGEDSTGMSTLIIGADRGP